MAIRSVRVVVAGDTATGKSTLIAAARSSEPPKKVPPVIPPAHHKWSSLSNCASFTIIDTPSGPEQSRKREEEFRRADSVVLTYACDRLSTIESLKSYWLPELRRLKLKVPVLIAGCKWELRDAPTMKPLLKAIPQFQYPEIDNYMECSVYTDIRHAQGVFDFAVIQAVYPFASMFDKKTQTLMPQCLAALRRIFLLCDLDRDGALNDSELREALFLSSRAPPKPSDIVSLKRDIQDKLPVGVNEHGLTLEGFLFQCESAVKGKKSDLLWKTLRKFGYNDDIRLDDFPPFSFKRAPDQTVELTNDALDFLRETFSMHCKNNDGVICAGDLEHFFSTAPDCPWSESPYMGAASTTVLGGLTQDGFLSSCVLMTLLDPAKSVEYLKYIMYDGDATSAIRITRKRLRDRKGKQSERGVYQCFVFGPKNAGKTALLDGFLGRAFSDTYIPNTEERYAVNVVDATAGTRKFLVLREIPEAKVQNLLSDKESLAACDVAIFMYDSTDESSFKKTAKLLAEVARHGEDTGYEVPSMIVSAKEDLNSYSKSIKDSTRLSQDMGIDDPVPVSAKRGDLSDIFKWVVTTAEHPHLNIPQTEAGSKTWKQCLRPVNTVTRFVQQLLHPNGCLSGLFYVFLGHK